MTSTGDLESVLEKEVELLGYEMIRLDSFNRGRKRVLRLYIDEPEKGINIDDCVKVTRSLSLMLDGDELIQGPYNLEVSSPGIDRPLARPSHFRRFAGHRARVEFRDADGSKRTVRGEIGSVEEGSVTIVQDGEEIPVEFDSMINVRPSLGNRSRGVDDPQIRGRIIETVESLVIR